MFCPGHRGGKVVFGGDVEVSNELRCTGKESRDPGIARDSLAGAGSRADVKTLRPVKRRELRGAKRESRDLQYHPLSPPYGL